MFQLRRTLPFRRKLINAVFAYTTWMTIFVTPSALARHYDLQPNSDIIGSVDIVETSGDDSFITLANRYDVSVVELVAANPHIDAWQPGTSQRVVIPSRHVLPKTRQGIVINLAELRLYAFSPDGKSVDTYPVGVGTEGWATPEAKTKIIQKIKNPSWHVPASIMAEHRRKGEHIPAVMPPGPDNPLGAYAMRLATDMYLIHGTDNPESVGRRRSHGCIRMYPWDVDELFHKTPIGTPVQITHEPVKLGFDHGKLVAQIHPAQNEYIRSLQDSYFQQLGTVKKLLERMGDAKPLHVDWNTLKLLANFPDGIPMDVGTVLAAP